ncbi:MAG TPA: class I SAM-dependent methyltransferase [Hyphomicrobiaceae bacterium]|nr:class I SAM-dependent methyltransferase [Hyphomicrobiaceae bacterium]
MSVDPKAFWEDKILTWEKGRYQPKDSSGSLLERIADASSRSLRYRIKTGVELLTPHIKGKSVLEVGCGSGLIAQALIDAGASRYVGIDIAENAIAIANKRKAELKWSDRIAFKVGTIREMAPVAEDVVLSLGVLDWLTDEELEVLFQRQGKAQFMHAIAEKRNSLSQLAHRAYVQVSYGYRTGAYRPRYFRAATIASLAGKHQPGPFYAFRNKQLSFGALISSLPVGERIAL